MSDPIICPDCNGEMLDGRCPMCGWMPPEPKSITPIGDPNAIGVRALDKVMPPGCDYVFIVVDHRSGGSLTCASSINDQDAIPGLLTAVLDELRVQALTQEQPKTGPTGLVKLDD